MFTSPPQRRVLLQPGLLLGGLLLAAGLSACEGVPGDALNRELARQPAPLQADSAPLARRQGERLPAFSGGDPRARGWLKVDELLWIDRRDEEAYRRGLVSDGVSYVSVGAAPTRHVAAQEGFRLRTDHLAVYTNASWRDALQVAREAEGHLTRVVGGFGDVLDLRLPEGPMKVVVTATRAEFEQTLRGLVRDPVGWGAFYDARSGNVYVSLEPAVSGPLPWRADLRHEMTHQIVDLSRPPSRRGRAFEPPWFWLWEGFSVWTEALGDLPGQDTLEARLARFRRRAAWKEATPLRAFFALGQAEFAGAHYDQSASVMRYLLDPAAPRRRTAVLHLMGRLLREPARGDALERALGMTIEEIESAWQDTVAR